MLLATNETFRFRLYRESTCAIFKTDTMVIGQLIPLISESCKYHLEYFVRVPDARLVNNSQTFEPLCSPGVQANLGAGNRVKLGSRF